MTGLHIPHLRLYNQKIARQDLGTPAEVVAHLGAVQAQDFAGAKWAIGLRLPGANEADVEQAIAERTIVRTWPMRGTLHFVPAADVRWMLDLMASRIVAGSVARYRSLGLDEYVLGRSGELLATALSGGQSISRRGLYSVLDSAGMPAADGRGLHILGHHAQKGLICFAAREGKEPTFALLDEWVPHARNLDRDQALAELAKRYFTGHGPATLQDFAWWSGLPLRDLRAGIEMAGGHLGRMVLKGVEYWHGALPDDATISSDIYLLPPFDEYTVAYKDRSAVVRPQYAARASSGGVFRPIIVVDGQVVGTWKSSVKKGQITVTPIPFGKMNKSAQREFRTAAERYAKFIGTPLSEE